MDRFIQPNWHVILIHYPLALLSLGLLIEIFCFPWRAAFRAAGRWMILLGVLAMIPAATSGIFALHDIAAQGNPRNESHWYETKELANFSAMQWQFARMHIIYNAIAVGIALLAVIAWIGSSDKWRRLLRIPALILLLIAYGFMSAGAWHGGEMVYHYAMGVNPSEQTPSFVIHHESMTGAIDKYIDPWQLHLFMAGLVFAISAAALALTIRASVQARALIVEHKPTDEAAADLSAAKTLSDPTSRAISVEPLPDDPHTSRVVSAVLPPVPSARFWILAAVVAVLTILGGFWIGDFFKDTSRFGLRLNRSLHFLFSGDGVNLRRMGMHIVFGGSILLLTLVLAILTRWKPRARALLATFSSLLILAMAGQVWMGILLLYDSDKGPISGFQKPPVIPTTAPTMKV